jgi:hypothetical protein
VTPRVGVVWAVVIGAGDVLITAGGREGGSRERRGRMGKVLMIYLFIRTSKWWSRKHCNLLLLY